MFHLRFELSMNNKDPPEEPCSGPSAVALRKHTHSSQMKTKQVPKWLDDAPYVFEKLEKVVLKGFVLATLIHTLIKIIAHH